MSLTTQRPFVSRSLIALLALCLLGLMPPQASAAVGSTTSSEFMISDADLAFILRQIEIAEAHATREGPGGTVVPATSVFVPGSLNPNDVPDPTLPWGLRQVDGRNNNLGTGTDAVSGRAFSAFGAADQLFPRVVSASFRPPYDDQTTTITDDLASTDATTGERVQPRWISNLVVDQSDANPAAVVGSAGAGTDPCPTPGTCGLGDPSLEILNTAPAGAAGVPYNSLFTFFGQFFDHGLDLVGKISDQFVAIPLPAGDVLSGHGSMYLNRTEGPPDATSAGVNRTTPWIDQNQTYASTPSKQVFIREYRCANEVTISLATVCTAVNPPVATGRLLTSSTGGIGTWADVKTQALNKLGIGLADTDVFNVPLLRTDEYGRFLRGSNGFPQLVQVDAADTVRAIACLPTIPCTTAPDGVWSAVATGHAFLDDIAHAAVPDASYDASLLGAHFVTGDGRGNENIGLTAIHTVFHAEHNRVQADIKGQIDALSGAGPATPRGLLYAGFTRATGWGYGERLFQATKLVMEMQYQHLVFDTFVRRLEPAVHAFAGYDPSVYPDVTAEFASAVYRFGHSMLTESVARRTAAGVDRSVSLFASFLNPVAFLAGDSSADAAATAAAEIARGSMYQAGNEIDEFVTGALRNNLVGIPLDLASLNIARGRDAGLPSLNETRRALWLSTGNSSLAPYASWADFGRKIKYRTGGTTYGASLVNFIAAYGRDATIAAATTVADKRAAAQALIDANGAFMTGDAATYGLDDVDLWIGGLAEGRGFAGGMLGSTFSYIFRTQMEDLQDGDRFYYLHRLAGTNLLGEVAQNTLADMFIRNTDIRDLPADMFSVVQSVRPAGTYTGLLNVVMVGTDSNDVMRTDTGHDTLRGFAGNDRIDGDEGLDTIHGGTGDDVLLDTGLTGIDLVLGGSGNDYIQSGAGADVNEGGPGRDLVVAGFDGPAISGGLDLDVLLGAAGGDGITGDEGNDWLEGRAGPDGLTGDLVLPPLGVDLVAFGNDVLVGGTGADTMSGGGGDDVMGGGDSGQATTADTVIGDTGFDWITYTTGNKAVNEDLALAARNPANVAQLSMDLFAGGDVEAMSGGPGNDVLRGDARTVLDGPGFSDALDPLRWSVITGLSTLLYTGRAGVGDGTQGNILIGGPGSDLLEGRAGNDLIDGDASLSVGLEHRCATLTNAKGTWVGASSAIVADLVSKGTIDGTCTGADMRVRRAITAGTPGSDVDVAVFAGAYADYSLSCLTAAPCTLYRVVGPDGDDVVRNVETLRFADRDLLLTDPGPSAPGISTASPRSGSAIMAWTAPTSAGLAGATLASYRANAYLAATGGAAVAFCTTATLTCTIGGLTNLTTYYVSVVATNSYGTMGVSSARVAVTPRATAVVPGAPLGVTVTGTSGRWSVTWRPPLSDGGATITRYVARLWSSATGTKILYSCVWGSGTLTCGGVGARGTYYVDVVATNSAGTGAASSPRVKLVIL